MEFCTQEGIRLPVNRDPVSASHEYYSQLYDSPWDGLRLAIEQNWIFIAIEKLVEVD